MDNQGVSSSNPYSSTNISAGGGKQEGNKEPSASNYKGLKVTRPDATPEPAIAEAGSQPATAIHQGSQSAALSKAVTQPGVDVNKITAQIKSCFKENEFTFVIGILDTFCKKEGNRNTQYGSLKQLIDMGFIVSNPRDQNEHEPIISDLIKAGIFTRSADSKDDLIDTEDLTAIYLKPEQHDTVSKSLTGPDQPVKTPSFRDQTDEEYSAMQAKMGL